MPFADNNGARIHWDERGEGTPLLLVMGHSYSGEMWYPVLDVFAAEHRVIWFDNRGTGESSSMRKITVPDMCNDAFAVMDAAGVDSAHLYGVSMGGGIVLEMARMHPERTRSLLLGCTTAKTPDTPGLPWFLAPLIHLPAPLLFKLLTAMRKENPTPYGTKAPAELVARDEQAIAADKGSVTSSVAQSRAINAYSITEAEVKALQMPTLVLHGDEDGLVPYAAGVKLHQLIAHSEMVTIPGAGHNYFVAGGDLANKTALEFIRGVDETQAAATA